MDSKGEAYTSILNTICYADIFDYPLKEEEVKRWSKIVGSASWRIKKANGVIMHKGNFMFLKGREEILTQRLKREKISDEKLSIAKRIGAILKFIPTIKLIGVSGSVAMSNAKEDDDIDFFIITSAKTIWLTRLLTTIVAEIFSQRRRPGDTQVSDKVCLNMFVDEQFLSIPKAKQNLYTAHEACQLRVLYDKDNTYSKFLTANEWVRKFLPNGVLSSKYQVLRIKTQKNTKYIIHNTLYILEWIAKKVQLWYMRERRTSEVITEGYLAFHPRDYTSDIMTAFEKKVARYGAQV